MTDASRPVGTLLDRLFALRDAQRADMNQGVVVVHGDELAWERNDFGKMRWYLHPDIAGTSNRSFLFYELEIPPGGRTGRLKTPGDEVILYTDGEGYTTVDGVKNFWKAGDVLGLPMRQTALVVQHFNADKKKPARFVSARPNVVEALGLDRGVGFELLERAPEEPKP
jgi:quercetin dioxygenase-like cupin family protein